MLQEEKMNNLMRNTNRVTFNKLKLLLTLTLIVMALALTACGQQSGQNDIVVSGDTFSAPLPRALLTVDATNLLVGVVVDGGSPQSCANLSVDQGNGTCSCNINMSSGQHTISLVFSVIDAIAGTVQVATVSSININIVTGQTTLADFSTKPFTYNDDDNDGANNLNEILIGTDPFKSGDTAGVDPVTLLTNSDSSIITRDGQRTTLTIEGGFSGGLELISDIDTHIITLANGIPSINVVNVQRTLAIDFSCSDGTSFNATKTSDFLTGRVDSNGIINGQTHNCTSTFRTVLPTTITGDLSIKNLLVVWGSDDALVNAVQTGLISTTCPQDDALDNLNPFVISCSGNRLENHTVTDINNGMHEISTKLTFSVVLTEARVTLPPAIAHYDFNGRSTTELKDVTGNGHDGIITGAIRDATESVGGRSLRFDGVNDVVIVADETGPDLDLNTTSSVLAWFKLNARTEAYIVTKALSSTDGYGIFLSDPFTTGEQLLVTRFGAQGNNVIRQSVHSADFLTGTWHQVVSTYDFGTGAYKMYLDGALVEQKVISGFTGAVTHPLAIGRRSEFGSLFFNGWIDEVSLYDVVLTDAQIEANYDEFNP